MSNEAPGPAGLTPGLPVILLEGEVDLATAPAIQQEVDDLLVAGRSTIVVDLLGATFLDSTALGVLVGALEECRATGGELHLIVTDPRILKVLQITGLDDTFPIHSTRPDSEVPPS
ncbi:MAG: STAS domain-containing protein [Acidimicrobiales bacterium]